MAISLELLPGEVLQVITEYLPLQDSLRLSAVNTRLRRDVLAGGLVCGLILDLRGDGVMVDEGSGPISFDVHHKCVHVQDVGKLKKFMQKYSQREMKGGFAFAAFLSSIKTITLFTPRDESDTICLLYLFTHLLSLCDPLVVNLVQVTLIGKADDNLIKLLRQRFSRATLRVMSTDRVPDVTGIETLELDMDEKTEHGNLPVTKLQRVVLKNGVVEDEKDIQSYCTWLKACCPEAVTFANMCVSDPHMVPDVAKNVEIGNSFADHDYSLEYSGPAMKLDKVETAYIVTSRGAVFEQFSMPNLQSLTLSVSNVFEFDFDSCVNQMSGFFRSLADLEQLEVHGFSLPVLYELVGALTNRQSVRKLALYNPQNQEAKAIKQFFKALPGLRYLEVHGAQGPELESAAREHCTKLESVTVYQ